MVDELQAMCDSYINRSINNPHDTRQRIKNDVLNIMYPYMKYDVSAQEILDSIIVKFTDDYHGVNVSMASYFCDKYMRLDFDREAWEDYKRITIPAMQVEPEIVVIPINLTTKGC